MSNEYEYLERYTGRKVATSTPVRPRDGGFSYDPWCEALARHFLNGHPYGNEEDVPKLAQDIQDAAETYMLECDRREPK